MTILRISSQITGPAGLGGFGLTSGTVNNGFGLRPGTASVQVMKGIIPTQTELNNIVHPFRSSDLLIDSGTAMIATRSGNSLTWPFRASVAATATGVATWFIWFGSTNGTIVNGAAMVGTISVPGGGGDMTLTDINIVSGNLYNFESAQFDFPRDFTY